MVTFSCQISLTRNAFRHYHESFIAEVAQPVEQRTENPCVDGSIPSLGTTNQEESRLVVYGSKAGFLFEDDDCGTLARPLGTRPVNQIR